MKGDEIMKLGTTDEVKAVAGPVVILDRDFFTIPEDDILKIRPLMTMVGGKQIVLQGSLAKEWGVPEMGRQPTFTDAQIEWTESR